MGEVILRASEVTKDYAVRRGSIVHALRGVSVSVEAGRTLGIVGESGCGKSTLARLLVGLEPVSGGTIELLGRPVEPPRRGRSRIARTVQLVFQDPYSSLDPRLTVVATMEEVLKVHGLAPTRSARRARAAELLGMVALGARFLDRYPHELSGGQAQRVAIARALAVEPRLLVLDEPTSALDVSVRAEVMNLLVRLQDELALSYVFISHDLAMVRHVSDEIAVMYLGAIVERGPYGAVLGSSLHPYTRALGDAVPVPDPSLEPPRASVGIAGEVLAHAGDPPAGCPYHPRCPIAEHRCRQAAPVLTELLQDHLAACYVAARDVERQRRARAIEEEATP